jgi:protein-disulfide isomerase
MFTLRDRLVGAFRPSTRAVLSAVLVPVVATTLNASCARPAPHEPPQTIATATVPAIVSASSEPVEVVAPQPVDTSKYAACSVSDGGVSIVSASDPSAGPGDAPVTLIEFTDLQCPFCSRAQPTIVELQKTYGEKLRVVWKSNPLPFHARAEPAAELAEGIFELAGPKPFWKFIGMAFGSQQDLSDDTLLELSQEAGANQRGRLQQGLNDGTWKKKIDEDKKLAAAVGARGTPTFFINGRELTGAQPIEKFKEIIDDEIAQSTHNGKLSGVTAMATGCERMRGAFADVLTQGSGVRAPATTAATGTATSDTDVWKIPITGSPVRGKDTALVTIVEWGDYQCPFTKRAQSTLAQLRTKYGDKIRVVWKDNPLSFHPRAEPAAEVAREALAQKTVTGFWTMHDALFNNAPKLDDADLLDLAKGQGLNTIAVSSAISSHKYKSTLDSDAGLAEDFGAAGTPTFYINGRKLIGAQPIEKFSTLIDEEMTKAEALVAKGTPARGVYDKTVANGKTPPPLEKKAVPVPSTPRPFKGPATAKVTVQMFADFQCPFCARSRTTMDQILAAYPTNVRVMWRHMPLTFHKQAELAAEAAEEAFAQGGSTAFWKMHDLLFAGQSVPNGLERTAIDGYAATIGLDMKRFKAAIDGHIHETKVKADMAAATAAQITGTPGFVINGFFVSGAQPFAKFKKVIDTALRTP